MINYGKHYIDNTDFEMIDRCMKGSILTCGPYVSKFEEELKKLTKYKYAIAVNSGTAALHAACFAAGITKGDEVIIPSITFVATSNVVIYQGAKPIFCDIEEDTLLIDANKIEQLITPKTKAIICVDYAGQLCDYKKIKEICNKYNLKFIADSCHALGAFDRKDNINIPDFICYSFHPVKHITTGEGGAVLCDNDLHNKKIRAFITHGRYSSSDYFMEMQHIGFNYRMSDINAALGISQIEKLVDFVKRRCEIANLYDLGIKTGKLKKVRNHVYHLYVIKVENRAIFLKNMKEQFIKCGVHYIPVYHNIFYKDWYEESKKNCPVTEKIYNKIVSLPIFYSLLDAEIEYIIKNVERYCKKV